MSETQYQIKKLLKEIQSLEDIIGSISFELNPINECLQIYVSIKDPFHLSSIDIITKIVQETLGGEWYPYKYDQGRIVLETPYL